MRDLKDFGSSAHPLRASGLGKLIQCPLRAVLMYLSEYSDTSGKAADTGSLVHAGAEAFHRTKSLPAALKAMRDAQGRFPSGDIKDAALSLTPYCNDPRNAQAEVTHVELNVRFTLGDIHVTGTLDQIRRGPDGLELWDIKTGERFDAWEMSHEHAIQLAAYCVGASQLLGTTVHPGGIIRTRGYRVRGAELPSPNGVFVSAPFRVGDCDSLLRQVRYTVAAIRRGDVGLNPGSHCMWCPAKSIAECVPKLVQLGLRG